MVVNVSQYQIIILSGPSGAGKSSFIERLLAEEAFQRCVTCTTRAPREGEKQGVDYYFLTMEAFTEGVDNGEFIESSIHYGCGYGVRQCDVENATQRSHSVITLNWEGAKVLESKCQNATTIYIEPPSLEVLKARLEKRGDHHIRLQYAEEDMAHAELFKYRLVNDDFDETYEQLKKMIKKILIT